jgi:hypothetical protein
VGLFASRLYHREKPIFKIHCFAPLYRVQIPTITPDSYMLPNARGRGGIRRTGARQFPNFECKAHKNNYFPSHAPAVVSLSKVDPVAATKERICILEVPTPSRSAWGSWRVCCR